MYDNLVKRLHRCAAEAAVVTDAELMIVAREAADAIEELQGQHYLIKKTAEWLADKVPRWIPVTERLPEAERKSYWVCTDTGYQCECRWTNNRFGIKELDEWGWCLFDIPPYQKVVAWMPLPCPYEPPEEGET